MVAAGYEDGIAVHLGCTFIVLIVKRDEKHLTHALCSILQMKWCYSKYFDGSGGGDGYEPDGCGVDANLQPKSGEWQGQVVLGGD